MPPFGSDDRAQSEIIGAILLIAITLVLASLVAVYVFDVGQQTTGDSAPQVAFSFDLDGTDLSATHEGGQSIDGANVEVRVAGSGSPASISGTIDVGDTIAVATNVASGDEVRIVYINPNTGQGTVLALFEA